ncbi:anthranilate synthase component I [Pacificimonas flava]|uniref:Anthranilate synthase component 1 n=2 Tax=Pacificimonas TaxID=1960290 RepID=A0A219B8M7_9SPHN|nr:MULTISPECIES: chorismate-binding protein [Pacificimonas]MBZ6378616.1 chorismate-binding protein [Pacificimonas aurantium]OWV34108.1 anthranilate synthase component I [Pacificimonas flava]
MATIEPPRERFREVYEAGRPQLAWVKTIADTDTPVSAMLKLARPKSGAFLLESVEGGEVRGRYTMLGFDPDLAFRARDSGCEINRDFAQDQGAFEEWEGQPLENLRALVGQCRMEVPQELPPVFSTLVGYLGYESICLTEPVLPAEGDGLDLPDMFFVRPSLILVFDQLEATLFIAAPVYPKPGVTADAAWTAAEERIETARSRLAGSLPARSSGLDDLPSGDLVPAVTPEAYADKVARAKEYILAGDIFQVVLAQRFSMDFPLPPLALYRALRRVNPSPFLYLLDLPDFSLIGSSPEILVRVRGDEVTVRPIAGTRPRGTSAAQDEENRTSLLADPKERAEHLMLLDLGRNDAGRVASPGSVEVTGREMIEFYSHVMHIVSNVTARLAPGHDALDALMAGFPAGTVSGAPKVRAMQIIGELENERRGPYAGGVGYFSPGGDMDSCIILRTAVLKDGVMHVQAGAGIVADSEPSYEQRECEAKAGALVAAAREALRLAAESEYGQ